MKSMKKILICCICVVALVAASVFGTLAYLTDRDSAVNTFTVGKVDIKLDEADVDENGQEILDDGGNPVDRVQANEYHLLPGQTYVKDPTVTVLAGSEESYVRMLVTINNLSELQAIFGSGFLPQNYVAGWDNTVWTPVSTTDNGDNTITYMFYYHETVDGYNNAGEEADEILPALFETFTVPGEVTGEQLKTIADLEITVVGHAIQAAGFDTADAAWAAFDQQVN